MRGPVYDAVDSPEQGAPRLVVEHDHDARARQRLQGRVVLPLAPIGQNKKLYEAGKKHTLC